MQNVLTLCHISTSASWRHVLVSTNLPEISHVDSARFASPLASSVSKMQKTKTESTRSNPEICFKQATLRMRQNRADANIL